MLACTFVHTWWFKLRLRKSSRSPREISSFTKTSFCSKKLWLRAECLRQTDDKSVNFSLYIIEICVSNYPSTFTVCHFAILSHVLSVIYMLILLLEKVLRNFFIIQFFHLLQNAGGEESRFFHWRKRIINYPITAFFFLLGFVMSNFVCSVLVFLVCICIHH